MNIIRASFGKRTFFGIRREVRPQDFSTFFSEALPKVFAELEARGVQPLSPPASLYHAHYPEEGTFDLHAGAFVPHLEADLPFSVYEVPEGDAAVGEFVGPYDQLGGAHDEIGQYAKENALISKFPCWEIFLNDPASVASMAECRTEVGHYIEIADRADRVQQP